MRTKSALWFAAIGLTPFAGFAASITTPPTLIIPNFDRALVGQLPGLEAGSYAARANDPSANWYNPAGLSRAERTSINASSSAYGWTSITANAGGQSIGQTTSGGVPQFFGVVIAAPILHTDKLRAGFSLTQETSWNPVLQEQVTSPLGGGTQRINYSIRDDLGVSLPALSIGYHDEGPWRFGATVGFASANYQGDEGVSEQQLSPTSQANLIRTTQISASSFSALVGLGAQYDISEHWKAGLSIRSPTLRLWGSSKINYESLNSSGGQTTDTNFYDDHAKFQYRLPLAANLGIAYISHGFEIEADLRYHAPVSTYTFLSSNQPISTSSNTGGAPTTSSQDFTAIQMAFRNVVDFAVGANFAISPSVRLHGGYYSSNSPVKDATNPIFRKIDLHGLTFGSSVTVKQVSGSLGLAYEFGTTDPFTVLNTLSGTPFDTTIHISTLKLLFALTIGF
ncbi:MAG: OmpP1/FadL family transporter [Bdellovibrionia bacterium]